jgi:hypothetical protein
MARTHLIRHRHRIIRAITASDVLRFGAPLIAVMLFLALCAPR